MNEYSFCSNILFAGLLHRDLKELAGAVAGQSNNLLVKVPNEKLMSVKLSEIAHCIYQACSRGSCRIYNGEVTRPMKVWLHHRDRKQELRQLINKVMPDVQWDTWQSQHKRVVTEVDRIATKLEEVLKDVDKKISISEVKKLGNLGEDTTHPKTFQSGRDRFFENNPNWKQVKRSFVPVKINGTRPYRRNTIRELCR